MLGVLDLFDDNHLTRTAEDIATALDVSLPTSYRYVRLLLQAGLLQRVEESHYALGPRIIMLDHYIRRADPVLNAGLPVLRELVDATGFDCVLTAVFGLQVLDTYREMGGAPASLAYGRGRPRPGLVVAVWEGNDGTGIEMVGSVVDGWGLPVPLVLATVWSSTM